MKSRAITLQTVRDSQFDLCNNVGSLRRMPSLREEKLAYVASIKTLFGNIGIQDG